MGNLRGEVQVPFDYEEPKLVLLLFVKTTFFLRGHLD